MIGRYDYSIRDKAMLEALFGIQYETCCWAIRTDWRRNLASRDGDLEDSFSVQLILKGFGSPDNAADRLLDRGILGYDDDYANETQSFNSYPRLFPQSIRCSGSEPGTERHG